MIVFAAIVPHSPLLISSIGKKQQSSLQTTLQSYETLKKNLYITKPDSILLISPHAAMYRDAFSGNLMHEFKGVLKEFGDYGTTVTANADFLTLDHINRGMRRAGIPFTMTSQEELDYGFTIPLLLLTSSLPTIKLIPIAPALLSAQDHVVFGQELQHILQAESSRIAVIASADLSHRVNEASPHGQTIEGKAFDEMTREAILSRDVKRLASFGTTFLEKAESCGHKPIMILQGILDGMNAHPRELSYEAPFGVGYLTVEYRFG